MDRILTKTLANLYIQQGHLHKAYEILQALLEKDPSDPDVLEKIKRLRERLDLSHGPLNEASHSSEGRIEILNKWLGNVRRRKKS
ncbi:MAG: hypothetical protein A2170_15505 [Deltaproteobacteria bacterium RBG_13_53_10]|nr:MAG: hypothetical protein A2170_15505 [Deltaproteobacteria bacterium RBG_13_53_10]